jgi:hypothetical protein
LLLDGIQARQRARRAFLNVRRETVEAVRPQRAVRGDRGGPESSQKHVWRARITLATADGCDTAEVMRAGLAC